MTKEKIAKMIGLSFRTLEYQAAARAGRYKEGKKLLVYSLQAMGEREMTEFLYYGKKLMEEREKIRSDAAKKRSDAAKKRSDAAKNKKEKNVLRK